MLRHSYQQVEEFSATEERINDITMTEMNAVDEITGINKDETFNDASYGVAENQAGEGIGTGAFDDINTTTHGVEEYLADQRIGNSGEGGETDDDAGRTFNFHYDHVGRDGCREQAGIEEGHQFSMNADKLEEERIKDAKALEDAIRLLFDKSAHSKLGATVMLINLVATHPGITDKAADDIFATFECLLPTDNCLPGSLYQAKTLTNRLGLDFKNIDGCLNGCVLFDQEDTKGLDRCPQCGTARYKDMVSKNRSFKSRNGKVRYPANSMAWKTLDGLDPSVCDTGGFGADARDVRIQISCDGICPFKLHKSSWSAWPVLASFLNSPPWLITKNFFTMLTLLISGKSQVPFEHFDVWIRPLIDELKELWVGVPAYDVLQPENERILKLRGVVLYTTHDFPGYGTVSGSAHQGYAACPPCGDQLRGKYAFESKKITYRDARRWVRPDHFIRSLAFDKFFDDHPEDRDAPTAKTPAQQRAALQEYSLYLSRRGAGSRPIRGVESHTAEPVNRPRAPMNAMGRMRTTTPSSTGTPPEPDVSTTAGTSNTGNDASIPIHARTRTRQSLSNFSDTQPAPEVSTVAGTSNTAPVTIHKRIRTRKSASTSRETPLSQDMSLEQNSVQSDIV